MYTHGKKYADWSRRWPERLDTYFWKAGMAKVILETRYGPLSQLRYESENHLMMFDEALKRLKGKISQKTTADAEAHIEQAAREIQGGAGWSMRCVLAVGQKPLKTGVTTVETKMAGVKIG